VSRLAVGLLAAVVTAASLAASDVHGIMILLVVACAALAAGLGAWANSLKNVIMVTQ